MTHSGVVGGGVSALGPSRARISWALLWVRPWEGTGLAQNLPRQPWHPRTPRAPQDPAQPGPHARPAHLHAVGVVLPADFFHRHLVLCLRKRWKRQVRGEAGGG